MKHLRKSIVISVLALVAMNFPTPIFGQTTLAIQGGLSRATVGGTVDGIDIDNVDALIGITLGASATIPLQDKFSLRLGGNYVQRGAKNIPGEGLEVTINADYIELSGLGVFKLAPSESQASVYMLVGPSVAFNTKCEGSASSEDISLSGGDCGEDTNSFDFGITGGIGAGMAISEQMTFSVDLLYILGILSVSKVDDIKNRTLTLRAGIGFPIGK